MRALGGAITSPCSNDSESRRPTPTIFGLSPHLLDFRRMLLDSPIRITALSGRLLIVFCVHTWLVQLPLQHWIICMLYSFVSADRRATARTTTSLSHAAIRPKKRVFCSVFFLCLLSCFFSCIFSFFLVLFFVLFFFVPWAAPKTSNHNILHFGPCVFWCFFWWSLLVKIGYTQPMTFASRI